MKKILPFLFLIFFLSLNCVSAETFIEVYRDGYVGVEHAVELEGLQLADQIELLSEDIENLYATDNNGDTVYYELEGTNLIIYNAGEEHVNISYYTASLTSKGSSSWSFELITTDAMVVTLPKDSTVLYIDPLPEKIDLMNNEFTFPEGSAVTMQYIFGLDGGEENGQRGILLIVIAAVLALMAAIIFLRRSKGGKRRVWSKDKRLDPMERRVLEHLYKNEDVMESEIRNIFNLPKTSSWRMMRRLEDYGYVSIEKRNKINFIKLNKMS